MKVLYHTCFADPWISVAQKLKDCYNFQPVYWIGYEDDDSENLIPKVFPDCLYQGYYEAWKGKFPAEVEKYFSEEYLDAEFLKKYATNELQAMTMMDRMDPGKYSFNFMERQRHYRNMLKHYSACLKSLNIDIVICDIIPHRVSDYVLYLLCRELNIKFVTFLFHPFSQRFLSLCNLDDIGSQVNKAVQELTDSNASIDVIKKSVAVELISSYDNIQRSYAHGRPEFVPFEEVKDIKSTGAFNLFIKLLSDAFGIYNNRYFGANGFLRKGIPSYSKIRNKTVEHVYLSLFEYSVLKLKTNLYKKRLKKYYTSLVCEPDLSKPYVLFNLHYQPEMTSCPAGGIFVDQRLCIETLSKHIPPDWFIYVKEHPAQFHSHREGHTSRLKVFYDDLLLNPKVRLVDLDYDPYILIKNSKAVSTITGTTGWEGAVLGKPVVIFGITWYEKYQGVLKITNEKAANEIFTFIDNFIFDEKALMTYLSAFTKVSSEAYYMRGQKEKSAQSQDECVNNLVNVILSAIDMK